MATLLDNKCAICGGRQIEKNVEKLLRGGMNFAAVTVPAEVCLHCGERFYSAEVIMLFEKIESNLEKNETSDFEKIGEAYKVAL